MKLLLVLSLALAACNDAVPPGIEPIKVTVVDAVSGAYLCNADVTLNGQALSQGGGNTVGCYFVPSFALDVGESYSLAVSNDGYAPQTQTGTMGSDGSAVLVQLVPTSAADASVEAGDASDEAGDASVEAGDATDGYAKATCNDLVLPKRCESHAAA